MLQVGLSNLGLAVVLGPHKIVALKPLSRETQRVLP